MKKQIPTLLALLSTILISGSANAHVIFGTREAQPGTYHIADLQIFHGCDGLATHTVTVDIPKNITQVRPRVLAGWKVSVNKIKLETPLIHRSFSYQLLFDPNLAVPFCIFGERGKIKPLQGYWGP